MWIESSLADLLRVEHGFAFKGEYFSETGKYVVLTPGNFHEEGGFRVRPGKDRFYSAKFPERYLLRKGDLIVAMTEQGEGLLGAAALIPESSMYLHNQRLGLVKEKPQVADRRFLYYLFNIDNVRQQIRNSSSGAKVRHTSPERIYGVKVRVPDKITQQQIAAILSAYDDLIENNRRRIALLEKMAEEIYREWFVRMRFPGHEQAMFEKGVPADWKQTTLGDVLELCYGKALKDNDRVPGHFSVYGSGGVVGTHNKGFVPGPGIIVGRKGNVGSVYWSDETFFPIDTVYYVRSDISMHFLYFVLQSMNFINNDAAVPGLNRNQAYSNKVLLPAGHLIDKFSAQAQKIFDFKNNLVAQSQTLETTRNALLPRLISGKLPVENLDIRFPPSMRDEECRPG
ncbi:restriction endonuclease subunit S [Methylocaldum sp.]|uniref:restriction endonuclease subunit S n=1 Tax=Methylocaldum sp. TaxID=1969727 RepID=UPI002D37E308|nr:restriction endonuclease subunit S [Methylocaldum sp.]HYE37301.1 restriction endonuclease subunit S [Methylocaldum sp.]